PQRPDARQDAGTLDEHDPRRKRKIQTGLGRPLGEGTMLTVTAPAGNRPGWLSPFTARQLNTWIIHRLGLQPYQHVLEVGSGTGPRLEEAARTLRTGFLAGVEPSAPLYQQAYKRNRRFIARQLMELHLGDLAHLPYPPHYFHTVFTTSAILLGKYPEIELLRL